MTKKNKKKKKKKKKRKDQRGKGKTQKEGFWRRGFGREKGENPSEITGKCILGVIVSQETQHQGKQQNNPKQKQMIGEQQQQ